jgi:hypothetical protein
MTRDTHFFLEYVEERGLYRVRTIDDGAVVLVDGLGEWISEDVLAHTLTKACGFKIGGELGDDCWCLTNPPVAVTRPEGRLRGRGTFLLCQTLR